VYRRRRIDLQLASHVFHDCADGGQSQPRTGEPERHAFWRKARYCEYPLDFAAKIGH